MEKVIFNDGWRFYKFGYEDAMKEVNLPHDAMQEEKRAPEYGSASGFFPGGKYVYEKTWMVDADIVQKAVCLEFEGVYENSSVYVNEKKVGGHVYGYTNFFVDLTDKLCVGKNTVKVIADNSAQPNSRWYSGSGIYRNVNLYTGSIDHIVPDGVRITTLSLQPTVIRVQCETTSKSAQVSVHILKDGQSIANGNGRDLTIEISRAKFWSAESPELYELKLELTENGKTIDTHTEHFGIRLLGWSAKNGFTVNGESVKLKGGCIHHDNGLLGACENEKAAYRKIRKMKTFGYNAIRYSHYPVSKAILSACDSLGMYIIEESFDQWHIPQTKYDYSIHFEQEWKDDLCAMIRKDYNHPSVIMYCIGNEISDVGLPGADETCGRLADFVKSQDASRPVLLANNALLSVLSVKAAEKKQTAGSQEVNDTVAALAEAAKGLTPTYIESIAGNVFDKVDIVGYNYTPGLYEGTHELKPDRVILSSETFPANIAKNWAIAKQLPYVIGDFMWTAWDYIGEAGVGMPFYGSRQAPFSKPYPCMLAYCGSFDITGYPESQAYYTAIVWGQYDKPYIAVRPLHHSGEDYTVGKWRLTDAVHSWSWSGCEGKQAEIEVYGNGDEVELMQDGVSLGRKTLTEFRANFTTTYSAGELKAVLYKDGKETAIDVLKTAGSDTELTVRAEDTTLRTGGDITWVNIAVTDSCGTAKPLDNRKITVKVEGAATLKAIGSANPETEESYLSDSVTTYYGRAQAIIESKKTAGKIKVTVSAEGLAPVTIEKESKK